MATIVPEWMETSEEREERRVRELQRVERLKQVQRDLHEANVRLCAAIVDEFIVEAACLKARPARIPSTRILPSFPLHLLDGRPVVAIFDL